MDTVEEWREEIKRCRTDEEIDQWLRRVVEKKDNSVVVAKGILWTWVIVIASGLVYVTAQDPVGMLTAVMPILVVCAGLAVVWAMAKLGWLNCDSGSGYDDL
jgi:hypothetical protein